MTLARTQDEILDRVIAIRAEDWAGFRAGVLLGYLDYDHICAYLARTGQDQDKAVGRAEWESYPTPDPVVSGAEYLGFAFGKARDHRGLSASRSVEKLLEWAWLAGRDDVVASMEAADYAQYGVPMLLVYAEGVLPGDDDGTLARMGRGLPCVDGCMDGCGS